MPVTNSERHSSKIRRQKIAAPHEQTFTTEGRTILTACFVYISFLIKLFMCEQGAIPRTHRIWRKYRWTNFEREYL